jgi:NADH-quinone oxidoreductase subunit J
MLTLFYIAAVVAVVSTLLVLVQANAVHALLYLIVSLLAVALIFFLMGTPFAAALEVIIYAGAVMVLFVFVIMMLNPGQQALEDERRWIRTTGRLGPSLLALILLGELLYLMIAGTPNDVIVNAMTVDPKQVSKQLFGPYLLGVELASMLLLPGLIGAYHLGRREKVESGELRVES